MAIAALLLVIGAASASAQVHVPRTVLVIHVGAETFPSNPVLDAGIRASLTTRADVPILYFAEYLEEDLLPQKQTWEIFSDYLRRKYPKHPDVVITTTDAGLRFVLAYRAELFPEAAIVFSGLTVPDEAVRMAGPGMTGITVGTAYPETLRLALELHPNTTQVFVVATGTDPLSVASVQSELQDLSRRISLTYLTAKTVPQLLTLVKEVPQGSLILYIWHSTGESGNIAYANEVAALVADAAAVPVYGTSDLYIGAGVVGGVVRSTHETGTRLGEMALQILTGTRAQDIPIATARVIPTFDWRQLRRWGVRDALLPAGAIVEFVEPSVWDRYRGYILGAGAVLLLQSTLIAALLIQRRRRRHAENQLRASAARVRDLGARLLTAQEHERAHIARELHDDINQQMTLLTIDLELLGGADEAVSRAQDIARSVHNLSHRLHPGRLSVMGLVPALESLPKELGRPGQTITFRHENVPSTLAPDLALCLFRIVQEALQNAVKYSKAKEVSVQLNGGPDSLSLIITDDGVGFDVNGAWAKGLGLISMGERIEAIGGTMEIRSQPGAGTRLEARAPIETPATE